MANNFKCLMENSHFKDKDLIHRITFISKQLNNLWINPLKIPLHIVSDFENERLEKIVCTYQHIWNVRPNVTNASGLCRYTPVKLQIHLKLYLKIWCLWYKNIKRYSALLFLQFIDLFDLKTSVVGKFTVNCGL